MCIDCQNKHSTITNKQKTLLSVIKEKKSDKITTNNKRSHASIEPSLESYNVMKKFKTKTTKNIPVANSNYYQPLQTLVADDDIADEQIVVPSNKKEIIPPLTILKCSTVELHEICKTLKIEHFSVRKISIGIKVFCQSKEDYDKLVSYSKGKLEFFEYESKNDKPFKAILLGLDKHDPQTIKTKLIAKGLSVIDVKLVQKKQTLIMKSYCMLFISKNRQLPFEILNKTTVTSNICVSNGNIIKPKKTRLPNATIARCLATAPLDAM